MSYLGELKDAAMPAIHAEHMSCEETVVRTAQTDQNTFDCPDAYCTYNQHHFNRNSFRPAHSYNYLTNQSCDGMQQETKKTYRRRAGNVHIKHQKREARPDLNYGLDINTKYSSLYI